MTANDGNEMAVFCSCGCKAGVVLKAEDWNADDGSVSLSLVSDEFYTEQATWRERLAEKCRRLWCVLRNKEYTYFEVLLTKYDIREFKAFVDRL